MNIFSCFRKSSTKKLDESKRPIPKKGNAREEDSIGSNSKVAPISDVDKPGNKYDMSRK